MKMNNIFYMTCDKAEINSQIDFLMSSVTDEEHCVMAAPYIMYVPHITKGKVQYNYTAEELKTLAETQGSYSHLVLEFADCANAETAYWTTQQIVFNSGIPVTTFIFIHQTSKGFHAHVLIDPTYRLLGGRCFNGAVMFGSIVGMSKFEMYVVENNNDEESH